MRWYKLKAGWLVWSQLLTLKSSEVKESQVIKESEGKRKPKKWRGIIMPGEKVKVKLSTQRQSATLA